MTNDLWNIFLNIVASTIYSLILWLWQRRYKLSIPYDPIEKQKIEVEQSPERRSENRQAFERAAHKFLFYFLTFSVLYMSITMPPLIKLQFGRGELLLNDA